MRRIRTKVASLALVAGLTLATAAPAQAFPPITYLADCPGDAVFQQLVIIDYSGTTIFVDAWQDHPNGNIIRLGTTIASTTGDVTYWPIQYHDTVQYTMTGGGNVDWFYHFDCYY